jgi:hypothetical protein
VIAALTIIAKVWYIILCAAFLAVIAAGALIDIVDEIKRRFKRHP